MENLSLKELKAQNAGNEQEQNVEVIDEPKVDDEYVEVNEHGQAVEVKTDSDNGKEEVKTEIESWMQTEEPETSEGEQGNFKPDAGWAAKRKAKKLQSSLSEKEDENAELKRRIAALESGTGEVKKPELPPRPTREQFDFDDDAYDKAIDDWNDKRFELKINGHLQQSQQQQEVERQQQTQQQALQKNLEAHYERAGKLVEDGKVTEESYRNADRMVRLSMDQVFQGQGDTMTNALISTLNSLGEGSEKVMYQLGVNPVKMQQLQSLLMTDPSGLSASAFLGKLQSEISTPTKRRSQAPAPGKKVDGESGQNGKAGTLHKQWSKSTNVQERVSLKRQARAQGVDVSKW